MGGEAGRWQPYLALPHDCLFLASNFFLCALKTLPSAKRMKDAQLCSILCDPMGYRVHGILQVRILEWVAFPFSRGSRGSSQPRDQTQISYTAGRFFTS